MLPILPPEAAWPPLGLEWGGCVFLSLSLSLLHFCESNDELTLPTLSSLSLFSRIASIPHAEMSVA